MNRILLLALTIFVGLINDAFAIERRTLGDGVPRYWNNNNAWSPVGVPEDGDVIIIEEGDYIQIYNYQALNNVVIEIYGTLHFQSYLIPLSSGWLDLDANSMIVFAETSTISSDGPFGVDEFNFIDIGDVYIDGNAIDELNNGPKPNELSESTLTTGGCAGTPGCTFVLPVILISFTADATANQSVVVRWSTAKEWNFSHYELQHSNNGVDFSTIEIIESELESNHTKNYEYVDYGAQAGLNYYRLLSVDVDGYTEDKGTKVAKVEESNNEELFRAYPNPSSDEDITLVLPGAMEGAKLQILTLSGEVVQVVQFSGGKAAIEANALAPGMYIAKTETMAGVHQQKLVIN